MEIIVPHANSQAISGLAALFPAVEFLSVDVDSALPDTSRAERLRAAGVASASGAVIALLEDHVSPDPGWAAAIIEEHGSPYAAIGGAIENGINSATNWAAYFADLGRYHNPLRSAESSYASVVNVSYKRGWLERVRRAWDGGFNETEVHAALVAGGGRIALSPRISVKQHRQVRFRSVLREFFSWGKCYGRARARLMGAGKRLALLAAAPLIPFVLLIRSGADVWRKRRLFDVWLRCLPLSIAFNTAWTFGEAAGYLYRPGSPE